jgi:excisionase family DNA binding protein
MSMKIADREANMDNKPRTNNLTTEEAAQYLNLRPSTLEAWRCRGNDGPRFLKMGKSVRYSVSSLDDFQEQRTFRSTSESR